MRIVLFLTLCVSIGFAVVTDCPDRWLAFEGSCYYFGFNNRTDFFSAQTYCQTVDANLVQIDDALENAFIETEIKDRKADTFWIGLTDEDVEGTWVWYPGNQSASFLDWYPGEPNSFLGGNEDCAAIGYFSTGYKWADFRCGSRREPICEIRRI